MVYRFDFLRLEDEDFPTDVVTGSTCYFVDTQELYIYYKGDWYLQGNSQDDNEVEGEGGEDEQNPRGGDQR